MRFWFLVLLFACEKGAPPRPDEHPPMVAAEQERAQALCDRYVERVCACAQRDASLQGACDLAKGQPEAVRMHLDVLHGAPLADLSPAGEVRDAAPVKRGPLNEDERRLTEASLRKVVAGCVKLDAELDPAKCPRR